MISLQEFFNRPEHAQAKGIVQKNNIIKRNIIAHMAIAGDSTLADLAKKLHISIPTVTKLVEELLAENIIADRGKIETSGGRRPNVYGLTNSAIYFAGIEVSRDQIVLVITDLQNNRNARAISRSTIRTSASKPFARRSRISSPAAASTAPSCWVSAFAWPAASIRKRGEATNISLIRNSR